MVVIANKRINDNKRVFVALTYIYGIGNTIARKMADKAGVSYKKVSELTDNEISSLVKESEKYVLEDRLREEVQKKKNEKIHLGTYHGRRLEKGLPVHGQSTRHNSRTTKRLVRGGKRQVASSKGDKKIKKVKAKKK